MKNKVQWIIFMICFLLAILMMILVITNKTVFLDEQFYTLISKLESPFFTSYFKFMTFWANTWTIVILCGLSLLTILAKKRYAWYLVGLMMLTTLVNQSLKFLFKRPRPEGINLIIQGGYSFPSGHTMNAFMFYSFVIFIVLNSNLSKQNKYLINGILGFLIINICLSRIYLGVHYLSDILGGFLISTCLFIVAINIIKKFGKDVF